MQREVYYGKFWPRVGALLLDTLVWLPITLPVSIFNATDWKSIPLLLILTLITTAYKPFMEYRYGATLGKMGVDLKVVTYDLERPSISQVLARNLFGIVFAILNTWMSINVFTTEGFEEVTTYADYTAFMGEYSVRSIFYSFSICGVYLMDTVFLWADHQKRSLHDRMANTLVVSKYSLTPFVRSEDEVTPTNVY